MPIPKFDIFLEEPGKDPLWMGAVEGFEQARERMRQLATVGPGRYFIYDPASASILDRTNSTLPLKVAHKHRGAA